MSNTSFPLTRDGRSALDDAKRIAAQHQQPVTDSLALLLALAKPPNAQVRGVLQSLNVKVDNFLARLSATIQLEARTPITGVEPNSNNVQMSAESECIFKESLAESKDRQLDAIDGMCLLLGMLRCPDSKAGQFLSQYGVTAEQVRERLQKMKETRAPAAPVFAMPPTLSKALRNGISPVFIALMLFTMIMAGLMWSGIGSNPRAPMFAFIIGGWIISVALHEFGHAITAFLCGDESVEHKGYLTLNPLKYTHPIISIVMPVIFLLMGGIGFPGGAVYINIHALRKSNYRSLVSAAGPAANILCVVVLSLPFSGILFSYFFWRAPSAFLIGLAFLALLQITSVLLNLLPIPGLDGFGIIEPFLPPDIAELAGFLRPFGFLILFVLLSVKSPISDLFWDSVWIVTELVSPNLAYYANEGVKIFIALR